MSWFVYIIRCTDNSLYTGITIDLERRFSEHKQHKGAKYFYAHSPVEIVYYELAEDRSMASKRELSIKKLTPANKRKLVASAKNLIRALKPK